MELRLPPEIDEFSRSATDLMRRRAGVALARDSYGADDVRPRAAELLGAIAMEDLEPGASIEETLATAQLCRAAGMVVLPYPIVPAVMRRAVGPFAVVQRALDGVAVDHADMVERVVALDGHSAGITAREPVGGKLARFACRVGIGAAGEDVLESQLALWLDLQAAYVAGALESAVELTVSHVTQRRQFGRLLSSFQALRFAVVEASLARRSLDELLLYTLWRLHECPHDALADALMLRVQLHEAARKVLAVSHQLHGAMGFSSEHDLSILTRGVQTSLRLPLDYEATTVELLRAADRTGLETLFGRFGAVTDSRPPVTTP